SGRVSPPGGGERNWAGPDDERELSAGGGRGVERNVCPGRGGKTRAGNRRWARKRDYTDVSSGHSVGFAKIPELLSWCDEIGLTVVTLWMLSDDNIRSRSQSELNALYAIDECIVRKLSDDRRFRLHVIGSLDRLPP